MAPRVIRRIRVAHCKRGPEACEDCRQINSDTVWLLELFPPGTGNVQRRAIQVTLDGEAVWCEFEIVTSFASTYEARNYAAEHGIEDVEL